MEWIFDELDRSAIPNENVSLYSYTGTSDEHNSSWDQRDQMRLQEVSKSIDLIWEVNHLSKEDLPYSS